MKTSGSLLALKKRSSRPLDDSRQRGQRHIPRSRLPGLGYNHLAIASVADFGNVIDFKGAVHRKTEGQLRLMNHPMIASRPMTF